MKKNLLLGSLLLIVILAFSTAVSADLIFDVPVYDIELSQGPSVTDNSEYWYLNLSVPQLSGMADEEEQTKLNEYFQSVADSVKQEYEEDKSYFEENYEDNDMPRFGYEYSYDMVSDTKDYFVFRTQIFYAAGSSMTVNEYWTLDKHTGKAVELSDLADKERLTEIKGMILDAMKQENESVFRQKDLKEYNRMQEGKKAREQSEAKKNARLDQETQQMLAEGQAFIRHIHEKNDEIPGEEFSEKLDRLEQIVTGIFERVEADPKSAPDLHRMMKYYLPTTQKLVDTYATLDSQNISGTNVENAKREIERSLDTINSAFERFLDQFFRDTAWDVSSDISVMGTMMAQDGLTGGDDFSEEKVREYSSSSGNEFRKEKTFEEEHGYTEGYTHGYSDTLGSGAAYAEAPDREGK